MSPNAIQIGQELTGSSGASAPTASFTSNRYADPGNSNFYYQGADAYTGTPASPPYDYWYILPSQSTTGGEFRTYCC